MIGLIERDGNVSFRNRNLIGLRDIVKWEIRNKCLLLDEIEVFVFGRDCEQNALWVGFEGLDGGDATVSRRLLRNLSGGGLIVIEERGGVVGLLGE